MPVIVYMLYNRYLYTLYYIYIYIYIYIYNDMITIPKPGLPSILCYFKCVYIYKYITYKL